MTRLSAAASTRASFSLTRFSTTESGRSRAEQIAAEQLAGGLFLAPLDLGEVAEADLSGLRNLPQRLALGDPLLAQRLTDQLTQQHRLQRGFGSHEQTVPSPARQHRSGPRSGLLGESGCPGVVRAGPARAAAARGPSAAAASRIADRSPVSGSARTSTRPVDRDGRRRRTPDRRDARPAVPVRPPRWWPGPSRPAQRAATPRPSPPRSARPPARASARVSGADAGQLGFSRWRS